MAIVVISATRLFSYYAVFSFISRTLKGNKVMSSSQQTNRSEFELDDATFPSPISSVRSKSASQKSSVKSSRKGSPLPDESNGNRRRSNRLSELEQKDAEEKLKKSRNNHEADDPELVLKKRKFNIDGKTNLSKEGSITTPKTSNRSVTLTLKGGQLQFNEPELGDPIISVTGLPLDAPPNSKIKKESLWPRKKTKKSKSTDAEDSEEDPNSTPEVSLPPENIEKQLRQGLKTNEYEKKLQPSNDRSRNVKPVPKKGAEIHGRKFVKSKIANVTTPKKKESKLKEGSKKNIKNASPKKTRENPFGFDNPMQLAGQHRENAFDFNDNTKDNEDFCSSCGEPGVFLCCESCPKSFHFACCDPPLSEDNLPDGNWFCNECKAKKNPPEPNPPGLFSKLLNQVDTRNPIQFKLPKKIRDRFEGVITGKYGEYEDNDYKPYRPTKIGAFEQTDPDLHFDKDGNILLCQRCGESGISPNKLNGEADKLITTCDYCPSAWHLDCLDPPLASVKQLGKKWKCPNHADHLLPNKPRRLRKQTIIDVDQVHGFKNDGNIEVKLRESDNEEDDEDEIHEIPTPAFLGNRDTQNGVAAKISKNTSKLWNDSYAIYRVPEEGVISDFLSKVIDLKEKEKNARVSELLNLTRENNVLLKRLSDGDEFNQDEKKAVLSLVELPELNFKELADIASKELDSLAFDDSTQSDEKISEAEVQELLSIKKLMALKGKDNLLKFLKG